MNQQEAFALWEERFGNKEEAYDYASHPIHKSDFQKSDSRYGWDIDRIQPYDTKRENLLPSAMQTIRLRKGKTSFKIGTASFEVRRGRSYGTFALYDITDRLHPMDMTPSEENQDPEFNHERLHRIATNEKNIVPASPSFSLRNPSQIFTQVFHEENADFAPVKKEEVPSAPAVEEKKPEPALDEDENVSQQEVDILEKVNEDMEDTSTSESDKNTSAEESKPVEEKPVEEETKEEEKAPIKETEASKEETASVSASTDESVEPASIEESKPVEKTPVVETPVPEEKTEESAEKENSNEVSDEKEEEKNILEETAEEEEKIDEEAESASASEEVKEEKTENSSESDELLSLRKEKEELEKKVADLEAENSSLSNKANEASVVISSLKKQNQDLLVAKDSILSERERLSEEKNKAESDKNAALEKLKENTMNNQENLAQILKANDALKEEVKRRQDSIESLKAEKEEIARELEDTKHTNISLSAQINELQSKPVEEVPSVSPEKEKEYQDRIAELENQVSSLTKEKEEALNQANAASQSQLEEKDAQISSSEKEKQEALANASALEASNKEKDEKITSLQNQLAEKEKELSSLVQDEEVKANQLLEEQKALASEKDALLQEKNALKEENEALKAEKENSSEEKKNEISALTSERDSLKQDVASLSSQLEEKDKTLSSYQEQINTLNSQKEEAEKKNSELQSLADASKQSESDKDSELASLKAEKEELLKAKETWEQEKAALTQEKTSLEQEKETLTQEKNSLEQEKEEKQKELDALQANYNQLDSQNKLTSDQVLTANDESTKLQKRVDELLSDQKDKAEKIDNLTAQQEHDSKELESLKASLEEAKKTAIDAQAELTVAKESQQSSESLSQATKAKNLDLQKKIDALDTEIVKLNKQAEDNNKENLGKIATLQAERDDARVLATFTSEGGDKEHFRDLEKAIEAENLPITADNVKLMLSRHREWLKGEDTTIYPIEGKDVINENTDDNAPLVQEVIKEDISYLDKERERKDRALTYYAQKYGDDKPIVSDFAGRYFRRIDFGREASRYGWDYVLVNKSEVETKDNVLLANLRSLKDFRTDQKFTSNGHTFSVSSEGGKYKILASDFIADPFNYEDALKVTIDNENATSPLIYIFVKGIGAKTVNPDPTGMKEFFALIDRTVKRACPLSFIEMKTTLGQSGQNIVFLTFDGSIDGAYKEALDYAILLNSYRREFHKKNILNAIIVLNEVQVPFSKRHLDYDTLVHETNDVELRALRYEFNMSVVNSTLKRTIHIGPSIVDKLPIDNNQDALKPSQIGQGQFATLYKFRKEFKVYNVVYDLNKGDDNSDNP